MLVLISLLSYYRVAQKNVSTQTGLLIITVCLKLISNRISLLFSNMGVS